ncbi:MAG: hypothetical protein HQK89_03355 [Nitrospirae bacterium]|nr:hypothetical protein [Nitrospirota bacterium]
MNCNSAHFYPIVGPASTAEKDGFRLGDKGTHTSRTIMFGELSTLLKWADPAASRADYATLIIEQNYLAKGTAATRRITNQRLGELYALNLSIPIFRILRRRQVKPSAVNVAYALFAGYLAGFRGRELFSSGWLVVLDCTPPSAMELALDAKRMGLIDIRTAGGVIELNLARLYPKGEINIDGQN